MSHGNELQKVVDKSQSDIDAAISAIKASEMSGYPRLYSNIRLN
jgi:hypothetical protein